MKSSYILALALIVEPEQALPRGLQLSGPAH